MSERKTKDEILELITLVDKRYEQKILDIFLHSPHTPVFAALLLMLILVEIHLFSIHDIGEQLTIAIAFSALVFVFFAMFERSFEKTVIRRNYKRLSKNVKENQKPLLKAIIKLKVKNDEFDLVQIYDMNADMFSKEKLLEKLYE